VTLAELRAAVADALATIPECAAGDWPIHDTPFDAFAPPAFVLVWGPAPWLEPGTYCTDTAQLQVVAVAARLTPDATYPILESMVHAAAPALMAARLRPFGVLPPGPFELASITYLAARIQIRHPVEMEVTPNG
jgi:hypothetical protein